MADRQPDGDERVEILFRNGTITVVGIVVAFSLGFLTHWAANPIPWQQSHLVAVAPIIRHRAADAGAGRPSARGVAPAARCMTARCGSSRSGWY